MTRAARTLRAAAIDRGRVSLSAILMKRYGAAQKSETRATSSHALALTLYLPRCQKDCFQAWHPV